MDHVSPKKSERKNVIIFLSLIACLAVVPVFSYVTSFSWFTKTLYEREKQQYKPYFHDDFGGYEANSEVLDSGPEDLSRWRDAGAITAWVDIEDWKKIDRIDLTLTDADGKSATLEGLVNLKLPREANKVKSNDEFPDHEFKCDQPLKNWEDFLVANGTNLLFWDYAQALPIDMSHIVSWKAVNAGVQVPVRDVVIHDGLCNDVNSLNGVWHAPNGLPEYGVWWPVDGKLVMRNVKSDQYPSNGDHVRILSNVKTPRDFLLKVKFTVTHVDKKNLENTYFRLAWDFDDIFDPGHDETVVYDTFKYGYLGLQRVYPLERYFTQGFEPDSRDQAGKTKFSFKEGHTYEMDVSAAGQGAVVEVYDLQSAFFRRVAKIKYVFRKPRPEFDYPFSVETTGNVEILLDDFEVMSK